MNERSRKVREYVGKKTEVAGGVLHVDRRAAGGIGADESVVGHRHVCAGQEAHGGTAVKASDHVAGKERIGDGAFGAGINAQRAGGIGRVGDKQASVQLEYAGNK